MKKITKIMMLLVMFLAGFSTIVGCGKGPQIESISVKSGLTTTYLKGDEPSFDDLKVKVVYDDGTEETIDKEDLTIGEFSTDTVGIHDVKISYKGTEFTVKIKVTNNKDEVYDILAVENNKHFVQYESALNPAAGADEESIFDNREQSEANMYKVGLDNPFVYNMNLTALDTEGEYVEGLETTKTVTTVYMKDTFEATTYDKVEDADVATYVEIDDLNSSYQFKEAAKNKFFKLEIRPFYLKESQLANAAAFTKTITFKVVEGYNVTNAKQLGILYNVNETVEYTYDNNSKPDTNLYNAWTEFLTANNITRKDDVKAIILHNDITVTGADVPSVYLADPANLETPVHASNNAEPTNENALYTDAQGNKKVLEENFTSDKCDGSNVYCHNVVDGQTFEIHGNFFTLDVDLPTVDTDLLPNYGSTTSLFRFVSTYSAVENETTTLANNETAVAASARTFVNINNLNSIGNAPRTDSTNTENNATSAQMGGLIFVKAPAVTLNVNNSIVKAYLINFYIERRLSTINLNDVKSYDAYQSIVYGYNGGNMTINSSNLERAGGPVILVATDDNNPAEKMVTKIEASTDSTLESLVSGREPWFAIYNMTDTAGFLKAQDANFAPFNSTFIASGNGSEVEAQLVNAILVNVSNDGKTETSTLPLILFKIGEEVIVDTTEITGSSLTADLTFINQYASTFGAPVFSKDGALLAALAPAMDNQTNVSGDFDYTSWISAMTADNTNGKKDYFGIYQGSMIMAIEYFAIPAAE